MDYIFIVQRGTDGRCRAWYKRNEEELISSVVAAKPCGSEPFDIYRVTTPRAELDSLIGITPEQIAEADPDDMAVFDSDCLAIATTAGWDVTVYVHNDRFDAEKWTILDAVIEYLTDYKNTVVELLVGAAAAVKFLLQEEADPGSMWNLWELRKILEGFELVAPLHAGHDEDDDEAGL